MVIEPEFVARWLIPIIAEEIEKAREEIEDCIELSDKMEMLDLMKKTPETRTRFEFSGSNSEIKETLVVGHFSETDREYNQALDDTLTIINSIFKE